MRIETSGNKAWRSDLYDRTARELDEATKSGGIDAACRHAKEDLRNKEQLLEWAEDHLTIDEIQQLCEILSTDIVELSLEAEHSVTVE